METSSWPEETQFVYVYRERQKAFVAALGKDEALQSYRLPVSTLIPTDIIQETSQNPHKFYPGMEFKLGVFGFFLNQNSHRLSGVYVICIAYTPVVDLTYSPTF